MCKFSYFADYVPICEHPPLAEKSGTGNTAHNKIV